MENMDLLQPEQSEFRIKVYMWVALVVAAVLVAINGYLYFLRLSYLEQGFRVHQEAEERIGDLNLKRENGCNLAKPETCLSDDRRLTPLPLSTRTPQLSPTPEISSCARQGSCLNGEICPTGTACSGLPAYGCYPVGCPVPICLAIDSRIATPDGGDMLVQDIKQGQLVWTLDRESKKVAKPVLGIGQSLAPKNHQVVHLVLSDSRELYVSPQHPTNDDRIVGMLRKDDRFDGSTVKSANLVSYWSEYTYDILPAGDTGVYWANGILLKSTLVDGQ